MATPVGCLTYTIHTKSSFIATVFQYVCVCGKRLRSMNPARGNLPTCFLLSCMASSRAAVISVYEDLVSLSSESAGAYKKRKRGQGTK